MELISEPLFNPQRQRTTLPHQFQYYRYCQHHRHHHYHRHNHHHHHSYLPLPLHYRTAAGSSVRLRFAKRLTRNSQTSRILLFCFFFYLYYVCIFLSSSFYMYISFLLFYILFHYRHSCFTFIRRGLRTLFRGRARRRQSEGARERLS